VSATRTVSRWEFAHHGEEQKPIAKIENAGGTEVRPMRATIRDRPQRTPYGGYGFLPSCPVTTLWPPKALNQVFQHAGKGGCGVSLRYPRFFARLCGKQQVSALCR
jgi:hypothetical protein